MKILIVTPAASQVHTGNQVTTLRWQGILRDLEHRVSIAGCYQSQSCDLLVALHARRSADSIERFRRQHPQRPLVVALTGTDLYRDIHHSASAQRSLELAWRLIVLQPDGIGQLPEALRGKACVIYQSVQIEQPRSPLANGAFEVCVIGHLRSEKDPFRAARAARRLPASSRARIVQLGAAMTDDMDQRARAEMDANPRYQWLGEVPRREALRRLARSRLMVLSSKLEGGANVLCEAIAASVPVLSSRISGSVGILGEDFPGYFPVGDTGALVKLLQRAEEDQGFYRILRQWSERLAPLVEPARERRSWQELLGELKSRGKAGEGGEGGEGFRD